MILQGIIVEGFGVNLGTVEGAKHVLGFVRGLMRKTKCSLCIVANY